MNSSPLSERRRGELERLRASLLMRTSDERAILLLREVRRRLGTNLSGGRDVPADRSHNVTMWDMNPGTTGRIGSCTWSTK